jgi:hypothetical protein
MGALADCEATGAGLFNSITTFSFLVAGFWIARRRPDRIWVGIAVMATGVGSFLFHGPMTAGAEWAHDVTLAWLLLVVAGTDTRSERWTRLPGFIGLGALFAVAPVIADPVAVLLAALAIFLKVRLDSSARTWGAFGLLGLTALVGRLGATGWPLCDPSSLLQTHGLWHLGAATAVAWWATALDRSVEDEAAVLH